MVTAVKHSQPRCLNYHRPFYITTNNVPDFGTENENVKRRILIFNTLSLPTPTPGIDQWLYANAMDCIAWMADEINSHRSLIPRAERWYEDVIVRLGSGLGLGLRLGIWSGLWLGLCSGLGFGLRLGLWLGLRLRLGSGLQLGLGSIYIH